MSDRPEADLVGRSASIFLPLASEDEIRRILHRNEVDPVGIARRVLRLRRVERKQKRDRDSDRANGGTKTAARVGSSRASTPIRMTSAETPIEQQIDRGDRAPQRVAENLRSSLRRLTDGLSKQSENAMSETKKSGVARMPATASGPFGARRTRCTLQTPRLDDPLQKLLRTPLARRGEDLRRGSLFENHSVVEEAHLVCDLLAKLISCVAMIIVMPSSARVRTSARTSPRAVGRARS